MGKTLKESNMLINEAKDLQNAGVELLVLECIDKICASKIKNSLKIPVIGTDVGGIPELITSGETGILVPPENPAKLAQAINELLSDKVKAETLAANGNIFVKNNMTWDVIFPKYIQFYENLLND